jgi:uncharacterized protein (DUF2267 family)
MNEPETFATTLQKTNEILGEIEDDLGWTNRRNQAYLALRVVLHALRDRLPIIESANFSAQLPILMKGIFYDGWSPEKLPIKMTKEEFIIRIRTEFPFSMDVSIEQMIKVVFSRIFKHINPEVSQSLKKSLPDDFGDFFG